MKHFWTIWFIVCGVLILVGSYFSNKDEGSKKNNSIQVRGSGSGGWNNTRDTFFMRIGADGKIILLDAGVINVISADPVYVHDTVKVYLPNRETHINRAVTVNIDQR